MRPSISRNHARRGIRRALSTLAAAAAALALACDSGPAEILRQRPRATVLESSAEPLREAFNAARGKPRLLAVLSPACPRCREGAVAVTGPVRKAHPELQVLLVWMPVLPWDLSSGSRKRIEEFADPPTVAQFVDPGQLAGRLVAERIGWEAGSLAYDVYLVYGPEAAWNTELPPPSDWFHQQREREPERYRSGDGLAAALGDASG